MEEIQNSNLCDKKKRILIHRFIRDFTNVEKVETLHKFYSSLPKQGSSEWCESRKIGASMAAAILGQNKYSSSLAAARELVGITKFTSTVKTEWGNLLEPVAKLFLDKYIKIYEFGSLPGFSNVTSCSPDGVFLMTEKFMDIVKTSFHIAEGEITLLEIKCPYNRYIRNIPDYYLPQLYLGMSTVSITTCAVFCEFAFRACSFVDFNFTQSQTVYGEQNVLKRDPICIGFIGYSIKSPRISSTMALLRSAICKILGVNVFPDLTATDFTDFITTHKSYDIYYSKQLTCEMTDPGKFLQGELDCFGSQTAKIVGVVCYKLFHFKAESVGKIDYRKQIDLLVQFGIFITDAKQKYVNDKKKLEFIISDYCKSFDNTVRNALSI